MTSARPPETDPIGIFILGVIGLMIACSIWPTPVVFVAYFMVIPAVMLGVFLLILLVQWLDGGRGKTPPAK